MTTSRESGRPTPPEPPIEMRVLVALHSSHGQTEKIGAHVADRLRGRGASTDLHEVQTAPSPAEYDVVVLGDSIHLSRHSRELLSYLRRHAVALKATPSALFQVSITSIDTDREHAATAQKMVRQLLHDTDFAPDAIAMFAGSLAYTRYNWATRHMVRAIAQKSGLDTDSTRDHEYTDWAAVDLFADEVYALAIPADTDSGGAALRL